MADPRLDRARTAFARDDWTQAVALLRELDAAAPLEPDDLDRLATAAHLVGDDALSADARARAHQAHAGRNHPIAAARSAFWLAFALLNRPDQGAPASGWLERAHRLLEACGDDCVEQGFLLCARGFRHATRAEFEPAGEAFSAAARIGVRFRDAGLTALARHGLGRVYLDTGRTADGLTILDEIMVSVTAGEVPPMVAGVVYCSVIGACHTLFDLRRARQWTRALHAWCEAHPDLVPFRGTCMVRRSELLRLQGDWTEALHEAEQACTHLDRPAYARERGAALYELAEGLRLRGDIAAADRAYRQVAQAGRSPHPGLALLRLAEGDSDGALHAIRHALDETTRLPARVHMLTAAVEVLLAGGALPEAERAAAELERLADATSVPYLAAAAAAARGRMRLASGDPSGAIGPIRTACSLWTDLDAIYEIARTSELLSRAYAGVGDVDGAAIEREAAATLFERLGAAADAARLAATAPPAPPASTLLTGRELEVLRLIAAGHTNRVIGEQLLISEKTVARHISNIFDKLDLPSRSAATAYAYQHKLV